jgi:hypothetical protein
MEYYKIPYNIYTRLSEDQRRRVPRSYVPAPPEDPISGEYCSNTLPLPREIDAADAISRRTRGFDKGICTIVANTSSKALDAVRNYAAENRHSDISGHIDRCVDSGFTCENQEVARRRLAYDTETRINAEQNSIAESDVVQQNVEGDGACMLRSIANSIKYLLTGERSGYSSPEQTNIAKILYAVARNNFIERVKTYEDYVAYGLLVSSATEDLDKTISIMHEEAISGLTDYIRRFGFSRSGGPTYCSPIEAGVIAICLDYPIYIYYKNPKYGRYMLIQKYGPVVPEDTCVKPIMILKTGGVHYNVLYPKDEAMYVDSKGVLVAPAVCESVFPLRMKLAQLLKYKEIGEVTLKVPRPPPPSIPSYAASAAAAASSSSGGEDEE